MTGSALAGGGWMIMLGTSLVAHAVLAFAYGPSDGDNAAVSVEFIREHPKLYVLAGVALLAAAVAATMATMALSELTRSTTPRSTNRAISVAGLFASAFFLLHGVVRISTPGTLDYIHSMDADWGESAYLAVQMIGTQGLGIGALYSLSAWAVGISVVGRRSGVLPRWVTAFGIFPALFLVGPLAGPLLSLPDWGYAVYIGSIFGTMAWCVALGLHLLRRKDTRNPAPV